MMVRDDPAAGGIDVRGLWTSGGSGSELIAPFLSAFLGARDAKKLRRGASARSGEPERIGIRDGARHEQRLDAVEDPAVAGNDSTGVLHTRRTFEDGLAEIACLPRGTSDERKWDAVSERKLGQEPNVREHRGDDAPRET